MTKRTREQRTVVFTTGHSTRPAPEFMEILKVYGIKKVVDVRTIARSRHNPQFNEDTLRESLKAVKIRHLHMKGLDGLRHARKDSPNTAWKNASFRGFADYMLTAQFEDDIERLVGIAEKQATVIMCAEAVPWRCHRSLIGDALLVRGIRAVHIMGACSARDHTLRPGQRSGERK